MSKNQSDNNKNGRSKLRTAIGVVVLAGILVGGVFAYRAMVRRSQRSSLDAATESVLQDVKAGRAREYEANSHQTTVSGETSEVVTIDVDGGTVRASAWGMCRERSIDDTTPRDCTVPA